MKAIVLCAGLGTRLGVLGRGLPKCLLPIGSEPLLAHTLRWLAHYDYREVGLNLHHCADAVQDMAKDGSAFGVKLEYRLESQLLGTAGALRNFAEFIADSPEVLVVYGDLLIDQDLGALREAHRAKRASATLLVHQRTGSNSLIALDADGRVTGFVERPSEAERARHPFPWVNSGVQILSRALVSQIPAEGPADLPRDLY
ncbi:MAG: nucleotidyltransferase family protein, partial [bacterium]